MSAEVIPMHRDRPSEQGTPPPHDLEAEAAVLSACMIDPKALPQVREYLRPEHFFAERHRRIFEAIIGLAVESTPIDTVTVGSWLNARGRLAQVGGTGYIIEVLNAAAAVRNVAAYGDTVHAHARARAIIAACQRFAAEGYTGYGDVQPWAERVTQVFAAIARDNPTPAVESNAATIRRVMKALFEPVATGERPRGIPIGLRHFDDLTAGLQGGQKTVVAAMTGRGKTVLALQACIQVARLGLKTIFVSTEVKREELVIRALCLLGSIDHDRMRKGALHQDEWTRLMPAVDLLGKLPIDIVYQPEITIEQIRVLARRAVDAQRVGAPALGLLAIDYIQRLGVSPECRSTKRYDQVLHATKTATLIAQELDIPVIEVAQANPHPEGRNKRPDDSCIADCKMISKEAHKVVFLHRYDESDKRHVTAVLPKQRDGEEGEVPLIFEGEYQRFREDEGASPDWGNR